ncbi:hypothetical protein [Vibrio sp. TRT 17S01]|uniref:hypothetical protein n=1 Tax=Vibrio sp. TRT 17S01 TaxID=3418505 RepID=UPI003CEA6A5B
MRLLTLILAFLITGCSDVVTSHYNTYQQAKEDKLFERGWLPDILPPTAVQLEIRNDLDLNTSTGHFTIPPSGVADFLSKLKPVSNKPDTYYYQNWQFELTTSGVFEYTYPIIQ